MMNYEHSLRFRPSILKWALIKSKYGEPGKRRESIVFGSCLVLPLLYDVLAFYAMNGATRNLRQEESRPVC